MSDLTFTSKRVRATLEKIVDHIIHQGMTARQLMLVADRDLKSTNKYITHLKENNRIFIEGYVWTVNNFVPKYRAGNQPDVDKAAAVIQHEKLKNPPKTVAPWTPRRDWAASWVPTRKSQ